MNVHLFNLTLLLGWLLVLVGGVIINVGAGLAAGGLLLILLVFAVFRISGIYVPNAKDKAEGSD
jgi:hypothetical protein